MEETSNILRDERDTTNQKITATEFLVAFKRVWDSRDSTEIEQCNFEYSRDIDWTYRMISEDNSILKRTYELLANGRPELHYRRELYTIDALIIDRSNQLKRDGHGYPTRIYVAIEHENGDHPEEEMWKLLWWRCPLKVIIFYDWNEYNKKTGRARDTFLSSKIAELSEMKKDTNAFLAETSTSQCRDSEYLLLIGQRITEGADPTWRYVVLDNSETQNLAPQDLNKLNF